MDNYYTVLLLHCYINFIVTLIRTLRSNGALLHCYTRPPKQGIGGLLHCYIN